MKKIRNLISFILVFVMLSLSVTAFAQESSVEAGSIIMGDINGDGKVSSVDARLALRISARLDSADICHILNADTDGNGKITSADSRAILRVSARLASFTRGFDGNGMACAVKTLKGAYYSVDASYIENAESTISVSISKNNSNLYLISKGMSLDMGNLSFSDCGIMILENQLYAILKNDTSSVAMFVPESLKGELGMSEDELMSVFDMINTFIPDDVGALKEEKVNGETFYYYSYFAEGSQCLLYLDSTGNILRLDGITPIGDVRTLMTFDNISGDKPTACFDLDNYEML